METVTIPQNYEIAVQMLADWHSDSSDSSMRILAFPDPNRSIVRLLELSRRFPSVGEELRPVSFGRSHEFPFPSSVILADPDDWQRIERRELKLPDGWDLDQAAPILP